MHLRTRLKNRRKSLREAERCVRQASAKWADGSVGGGVCGGAGEWAAMVGENKAASPMNPDAAARSAGVATRDFDKEVCA